MYEELEAHDILLLLNKEEKKMVSRRLTLGHRSHCRRP